MTALLARTDRRNAHSVSALYIAKPAPLPQPLLLPLSVSDCSFLLGGGLIAAALWGA